MDPRPQPGSRRGRWLLLLAGAVALLSLPFLLRPRIGGDPAAAVEARDPVPASESTRTALDYELPGARREAAPAERARIAPPAPGEELPPIDSPDNPYQVRGSVRLSSERPVPGGIRMRMLDAQGRFLGAAWSGNSFYFGAGLHAGAWTLLAESDGILRDFSLPIELTPADPVQRRELVLLATHEIAVRFTTQDGGELVEALAEDGLEKAVLPIVTLALPGAEIEVGRLPFPTGEVPSSWRGPGGLMGSSGAPEGDNLSCTGILSVLHEFPVFVSAVAGETVLGTRRADAATSELVFAIAPEHVRVLLSSVQLRAVDVETGRPVADALVVLGGVPATTDARGEARFEKRVPGRLELTVSCPGYARLLEQVRLRPGEACDLGVVRLSRAAEVRGRVVDEQDRPAVATIHATSLDSPEDVDATRRRPNPDARMTRSRDDGGFVLADLPPGRYSLRATTEGLASKPALVDTSEGPARNRVLRLERGGSLLLVAGPTAGGRFTARILDAGSRLVDRRENWRGNAVVPLPPGDYTVDWSTASGLVGRRPVRVEDARVMFLIPP